MSKYKNQTYSLTQETKELIRRIADFYQTNSSSAVRLSVLNVAKNLGLQNPFKTNEDTEDQ